MKTWKRKDNEGGTRMNDTPYINKAACKKFLLRYAADNRAHKFTRVAKELLVKLNSELTFKMMDAVHSQPSKGKTIT
jgi:hypothetical protein